MPVSKVRELSVSELKSRLDAHDDIFLLDVREPDESKLASIGGLLVPLAELASRTNEVPRDKTVVIYCYSGGRSAWAVELLQREGFSNLFNLRGGILAWGQLIDPAIGAKLG
ncbi:MAG: rhodanese-like domain-containing protein [Oligoflexia bacterium]|nr:rhodanese-like domain-containing protein [Oligoflexia bacterium]